MAIGQDQSAAFLERFASLVERGKTILDVGCGDGLPVDRYLVSQGFAVNGIDASAHLIERARTNVPEGFYEVENPSDLQEGEYCVDGIVSLRAMLHVPRDRYPALLKRFASFMPNGGALLLAVATDRLVRDAGGGRQYEGVGATTELLEDAGFTVLLQEVDGSGDDSHLIILART